MRCPACGAELGPGDASCPVCGAAVGGTQALRVPRTRWCPLCGALVRADEDVCPSCGAPLPTEAMAPASGSVAPDDGQGGDAPEVGEGPSHAAARPAELSAPAEVPPRMRAGAAVATSGREPFHARPLVVALVCALVVTGGTVLLIAHPWDPGSRRNDVESVEPSTSGRLEVETIRGQDVARSTGARLGRRGQRSLYEWESDAYELVLSLASRVDANHQALLSAAADPQAAAFDDGADEAARLVRELGQLEDDLASEDVDALYASDVGRLRSLVGWLATCARSLSQGWDDVRSAEEGARGQVVGDALAEGGYDAAWQSFGQNRDGYAPRDLG